MNETYIVLLNAPADFYLVPPGEEQPVTIQVTSENGDFLEFKKERLLMWSSYM